MLKKNFLAGMVACLATVSAFAQGTPCPCGAGTRVTDAAALATLLGGRTVCAAVGNDNWQEFHSGATTAGGPLIDYKRGPGDAVDPSTVVGSWSIKSATPTQRVGAIVSYDYRGGGVYDYAVCQAPGSVTFCGSQTVSGATLLAGQVSCGGSTSKAAR